MKISKLHIDNHKHLENLDFDFTYPEDFHIVEKRGKPLDKICFIGQSATGKTGLLELIYEQTINLFNIEIFNNQTISSHRYENKIFNGEIQLLQNANLFTQKNDEIVCNNIKYVSGGDQSGSINRLIPYQDRKNIFYFKANLISDKNIEIFNTNPIELIESNSQLLKNIDFEFNSDYRIKMLFNDNVNPEILIYVLTDILVYRKNFTQKMSEMIHKGLLANPKKLSSEFEKWQKDNPNKLEDFANIFNPILEKLHLEVDIVDTQFSIPIRNKRTDEIIAIQDTSTGTKGLLLSILPLFKLDTKDSIILMDEPERSLYPDLQMELIDYYRKLAPESQLIVATHSPFIAASFEPEERFILSFDEKGKVVVNRGISPIGDDPNDMLYNDFGINYINKYGQEKQAEYIDLKQKIYFEKDETVKKEYAEKLEKIGDTYNL